jgi:glycosyltransferase involved in cell wall biosynthesis
MDAQSLSSDAAGSGIARYTRSLIEALAQRDDVTLRVLCEDAIPMPEGVERVRIRRIFRHPRDELREHLVRLPLELRRARRDGSLFHNPVFHAPPGVRTPWVQTLHDVIPLVMPSPDVAILTARWKRFGPRYLEASAVIAISHHAAREGIRVLGLDPARVHVAHHGVDPQYVPSPDGPADPPYLLMVNEFSLRKGYAEAFAVMDDLADAGYPHRLVVAGRVRDWARDMFNELLATVRHPDRIDCREFVPDLVPLYQGATAFVMPSHYEGFGLTVLEAMSCGVPVVAFSNSAVTEVVGRGGELVPNGDVPAMTAAVRRLLDEPSYAAESRARALEQARPFTWAASAGVHAEVYRSVAADTP